MSDEVASPKVTITIPVDQAKAALRDLKSAGSDAAKTFETTLGSAIDGTSKKIKRLADDISGGGATRKLQDLEKALQQVGGVSNLTGTQVDNFASKIRALEAAGGKVPASLANIGREVEGLSAKLGLLGNINVGPALGAGLAAAATGVAAALVASGRAMVEYSSQVVGVTEKTGLTTDAVQKFMFVAGQTDVSLEKITKGAVTLQRNLGEGTDKVKEAVQGLGLSLAELRNASPDQQLSIVLEKISAIENPAQRAAAGAALLGKSFSDLIPVGAQMGALSDQAERLGLVMSENSVRAAEQLGDEFTALGDSMMGVVRQVGDVITSNESLHVLVSGLSDIVGQFSLSLNDNRQGMTSWVSDGVMLVAEGLVALGAAVNGVMVLTDAMSLTWKSLTNIWLQAELAVHKLDLALRTMPGANNGSKMQQQAIADGKASIAATEAAIAANSKAASDTVESSARRAEALDTVRDGLAKLEKQVEAAAGNEIKLAAAAKSTVAPFKEQAASAKELAVETKKAADALERAQAILHKQGFFDPALGGVRGTVPFSGGGLITSGDMGNLDPRLVHAKGILAGLKNGGAPSIDDIMPGLVTNGGVTREIDKAKEATNKLSNALHVTADMFQVMGVDAHSALGSIVGGLSSAAAAGEAFKGSLKFKKNADGTQGGLDLSSMTTSDKLGAGMAGAQGLMSIISGSKGQSNLMGALGGGVQGAAFGAQFGAIGAVVGAGAGALVGGITASLTRHATAFEHVGKEWGVQISKGLGEQIDKDAKEKFHGNLDAASLSHLGDIFGEAGGVGKFGASDAAGKVHDLFSAVEQGTMSLDQAGASFDEVFGDVAAAHISKTTGIASAQLQELVGLAKQFGIESPALQAFISGQATSAAGNLAGGLASLKTSREKGGAGLVNQGAASGLSNAISSDFSQMTGAGGMSQADALSAIAPAVKAMREELTAAGLQGGAAFEALEARIAIVTGEITGPLVSGIGSFAGALVNMHNMNALTQEDFAGITAQIGANITALAEQGVVGPAAVSALAPDLQKIWELQQKTGFAVDETTQNLLNEAVAAGLVGEEHRSAADKMLDATERMADAIEFLASQYGYLAKKADEAMKSRTATNTVNTNYTSSGNPPDGSGGTHPNGKPPSSTEPESYEDTSFGFRNFGSGTAAVLHGIEGVFNPAQISAIQSASYRIGQMSGPGGGSGCGSPVSAAGSDIGRRLDALGAKFDRMLDLMPKAMVAAFSTAS